MRIVVHIAVIVTCLLSALSVNAQSSLNINAYSGYESQRAQIRQIKLSEEYYYFEAVDRDLVRSEESALKLLSTLVSQKCSIPVNEIETILQEHAKSIWYLRGDRYNVFAYVLKEYFVKNDKITSADTSIVKNRTIQDSLVNALNVVELKALLARLHQQHRVVYGTMKSIIDIAPCHIVSFNSKGEIVSILEPGTDIRHDLKSGNNVSLDTFANGLNRVWFILY